MDWMKANLIMLATCSAIVAALQVTKILLGKSMLHVKEDYSIDFGKKTFVKEVFKRFDFAY